jgi:hypothetical protein
MQGQGSNSSVTINENVALDESAGPWLKSLVNTTGQGIPSGVDEAAVIAEFPSPEPTGIAIGTAGLFAILLSRRRPSRGDKF